MSILSRNFLAFYPLLFRPFLTVAETDSFLFLLQLGNWGLEWKARASPQKVRCRMHLESIDENSSLLKRDQRTWKWKRHLLSFHFRHRCSWSGRRWSRGEEDNLKNEGRSFQRILPFLLFLLSLLPFTLSLPPSGDVLLPEKPDWRTWRMYKLIAGEKETDDHHQGFQMKETGMKEDSIRKIFLFLLLRSLNPFPPLDVAHPSFPVSKKETKTAHYYWWREDYYLLFLSQAADERRGLMMNWFPFFL